MEKLTKQQFRERYANTKMYVDRYSEEIQKKLSKAGIESNVADDGDFPFRYIENDGTYNCDENMKSFLQNNSYKEIKAEEILNIEIVEDKPECPFKPFDKVVARDEYGDTWRADFFSHILPSDKIYRYVCIGTIYKYCLPYNEQTAKLIGTTNDYKEDEE